MDIDNILDVATESVVDHEIKAAAGEAPTADLPTSLLSGGKLNALIGALAGGAIGGIGGYTTAEEDEEDTDEEAKAKKRKRALIGALLGVGAGGAAGALGTAMASPDSEKAQEIYRDIAAGKMPKVPDPVGDVVDTVKKETGLSAAESAAEKAKALLEAAKKKSKDDPDRSGLGERVLQSLGLAQVGRGAQLMGGRGTRTRLGRLIGAPTEALTRGLEWSGGRFAPRTGFKSVKPFIYDDVLSKLFGEELVPDVLSDLGVDPTKGGVSRFDTLNRLATKLKADPTSPFKALLQRAKYHTATKAPMPRAWKKNLQGKGWTIRPQSFIDTPVTNAFVSTASPRSPRRYGAGLTGERTPLGARMREFVRNYMKDYRAGLTLPPDVVLPPPPTGRRAIAQRKLDLAAKGSGPSRFGRQTTGPRRRRGAFLGAKKRLTAGELRKLYNADPKARASIAKNLKELQTARGQALGRRTGAGISSAIGLLLAKPLIEDISGEAGKRTAGWGL